MVFSKAAGVPMTKSPKCGATGAMENNRECYHCGGHPELLKIFFQFFAHTEADVKPRQRAYYERYRRIQAEMIDIWENNRLPCPVSRLGRVKCNGSKKAIGQRLGLALLSER